MSPLDYLAALGPLVFLAVFLLTPWGQGLAGFLLGTRVGRWLSVAGLLVYAGLVAYGAAYRSGRRAGSAGALKSVGRANAQASADRAAIEDRTARQDDDALRRELSRYTPVLLAVVALGLGGCVTAPTGGPGKGGAFSDVERPLRLSAPVIAAMNHAELAAAVAHNRHGERQCGWTPGRKS
ncbi:hypothetical protein [Methylobacterium sp. ID0610]|uniref:hypothetical protein n=1 Tax=Methylobacterium carpenticola TaxID=3344827 RepID=UPI0036B02AA5